MAQLFEITADILRAYETLVDSDGEVSEENAAALEALAKIEADKLDGYYFVIRKAEMEESAAKAQLDQWKKKADARRKFIEYMKARVLEHLQTTGQAKTVTPSGNTFSVQRNGGKRPIIWPETAIDLTQVPMEYTKVVKSIDIDAVRRDLEDGDELPFARLGEAGHHLRLR